MDYERLAFKVGVLEAINICKTDEESTTAIFLNGKNHIVLNTVCNARYEVLDGEGKFAVWRPDGTKVERVVKPGDVLFIPPNTPYTDEGNMVMISTCNPPFNLDQVRFLVNQ